MVVPSGSGDDISTRTRDTASETGQSTSFPVKMAMQACFNGKCGNGGSMFPDRLGHHRRILASLYGGANTGIPHGNSSTNYLVARPSGNHPKLVGQPGMLGRDLGGAPFSNGREHTRRWTSVRHPGHRLSVDPDLFCWCWVW